MVEADEDYNLIKKDEKGRVTPVVHRHEYGDHPSPITKHEERRAAAHQYDSFIDEECSPREISLSHNNGTGQERPLVFNELPRENFEMLIGDRKRREIVQANQQARKTAVMTEQPLSRKSAHNRNHSELL